MHLLDEEFLDTIYRETKANTLIQKRNKCILGMIVFLGLQRGDIEALELDYLDLDEARLYVPATVSRNERYIDLSLKQMKDLMYYVYDLRPKLLTYYKQDTSKLFFSSGSSTTLNSPFMKIMQGLKIQFHYVKSFTQLQQSRVSIWVKELGLRQAQYLGWL